MPRRPESSTQKKGKRRLKKHGNLTRMQLVVAEQIPVLCICNCSFIPIVFVSIWPTHELFNFGCLMESLCEHQSKSIPSTVWKR